MLNLLFFCFITLLIICKSKRKLMGCVVFDKKLGYAFFFIRKNSCNNVEVYEYFKAEKERLLLVNIFNLAS